MNVNNAALSRLADPFQENDMADDLTSMDDGVGMTKSDVAPEAQEQSVPTEPREPKPVTRAELAGILSRLGPTNDTEFSKRLAAEVALLEK
jgi:hypothetical protein